jgi:hypothetical protein
VTPIFDPTQSMQRRSMPGEALLGSLMPKASSARLDMGESICCGSMKLLDDKVKADAGARTVEVSEGSARRLRGGRQPIAMGVPGVLCSVGSHPWG